MTERSTEDGVLIGTGSELAPGVGGTGDHPTPAVMRDPETGAIRVAGQPSNGAIGASPEGDDFDAQSGDVTDPAARARLNAVSEPEAYAIKRPDIGTE
jgi:hypothetical protein